MELVTALETLGGVARTAHLLKAGVRRSDLARGAAALRLRRGVYALPGCRADYREAILANGVLTCVSAAKDLGLWLRDEPGRIHLSCDHGRAPGHLTAHRGLRFRPHSMLPLADIADAVVHALVCQPAEVSVPLAASALRKGLSRLAVEEALAADRLRPALRTLHRVDERVESLPEAEALLLLVELAGRLGLEVQPQAYIPGIGRVDFLIGGWLIVEIDGVAFHADRASVRRDRMRDNAATLRGYTRLRYVPETVWREPGRFVHEVEAVLTGRVVRG
jgi:very-short-patch-repair endonuclease